VRVAGRGWMCSSLCANWWCGKARGLRHATWVPTETGCLYLYVVRFDIDDFVDHWPIVIGKVRAWLKYLLDKLFDQEGSSCSSPWRKLSSRASPSEPFAAAAPGNGYFNLRRSKLRNNASASRIAC
jgi:hypothetical protein